ncbi:MAG: hypothetical protein ACI9YE_000471 [Psychroserpens sp.]|jgi:hypothetical protein
MSSIRYQLHREELLDAMNDRYHNKGGKEKQRVYLKKNRQKMKIYRAKYWQEKTKPSLIYDDSYRKKKATEARLTRVFNPERTRIRRKIIMRTMKIKRLLVLIELHKEIIEYRKQIEELHRIIKLYI